jgi:Flp pilus assembly protein TadG
MLLRHFRDALARLWNDRRGNIAIMFAAASIPLLLVMGGAVDFARFARYKAELANAVDAAALALARVGQQFTEEEAKEFVEDYVTAFAVSDDQFSVQDFQVTKTETGYIVTAGGVMDTMFLPLGDMAKSGSGIMSMDMDILAEVVHSSNRVELALVFDNTGSMTYSAGSNPCGTGSDRMAGLKCAAKTLVNDLTDEMNDGDGEDQLKVALVPFEGAVNTGVNTSNPPSWIEWSDEEDTEDENQPHYTGINFEVKNFGEEGGWYRCGWRWCWDEGEEDNRKIGPRWLYEKLGISWAGCVEMRAEPYDVLDTPPDANDPDTLFLPMFWPDEPDLSGNWNNCLVDGVSGDWEDRQRSLVKYDKSPPSAISWQGGGAKDTTYPYEKGPNRGCPRPIAPLTTNEQTILDAIDAMQPQGATGTFIPVGLAWGWHVLSPTVPFTEGLGPGDEHYDKTVKAIILLTDGENSPSIDITNSNNDNESTYSAYNYAATEADLTTASGTVYHRLQNLGVTSYPSESTAKNNLDSKTLTLCANAKQGGVRLYTITFGDLDSSTEDLMSDCASEDSDGSPLYFSAPDSQELDNIFHAIGEDLSEIHLAM